MSSLDFLSPSRCALGTIVSPLRRALEGTRFEDLSGVGKVELRGDLEFVLLREGEELVRLTPRRGLLFTDEDPAEAVRRLRSQGVLAYDATAAWAGFAVVGERLMRRLTDLDLHRLPAAGPFARVPAIVIRDKGVRFRVFVPQELGHDVALAALDAVEGLRR